MDLIQSDQTNAPVEAEPRYVPTTATLPIERTEHGHAWLRLVATILAAIILIAVIVFLARWIYHSSHKKAVGTTSTTLKVPAASSSSNTSQTPAAPTSSSNPPQTSSGTPTTPGVTNTQITNTGPGNVAAIFVGSSLAAAGLHYIISIRRFSRNRI